MLYQCRREIQAVSLRGCQSHSRTAAWAAIPGGLGHGVAGLGRAEQGQEDEGIAQVRQGIAAYQATGAEVLRPYFLGLLAEAYSRRKRTAKDWRRWTRH